MLIESKWAYEVFTGGIVMKVLIVDDSKIERMILKGLLQSEGHTVVECKNGEEALQTAFTSLPDMIISDILMPVMDGYSFCRSIRSDSRTAHIPFFFYTATFIKDEDEALALKMGADGFFRKPIESDEFSLSHHYPGGSNTKKGRFQQPHQIKEEGDLYKLYNERLIKKLQDKAFELEKEVRWRKNLETELRDSRQQLRDLSVYLQAAIERERTKIAQEIHDDLGQILTAANLDLFWVKNNIPEQHKRLLQKTGAVQDLIEKAIHSVKKIASDLRPTLLDDLGLAAAIEWQASDFQERTGVSHRVFIDSENIFVNGDLSIAAFRVCQEALTNAARHAKATQVLVKVIVKNDNLQLTVMDNGVGIMSRKSSIHGHSG